MTATALATPRFVRRTRLEPHEYRKNFHQIDVDVISAVTSADADRVTPLMSKIYLRLTAAPTEFWESDGVLYFHAKGRDGRPVKASKVLYEVLGVASATAHKALAWMHEQGIIGYFSGKNGAGIRIFLNRATGSIGVRSVVAGKKILPFSRGSNGAGGGSSVEPAFNDSYAVLEVLDKDLIPPAPKNGSEKLLVIESPPDLSATSPAKHVSSADVEGRTPPPKNLEGQKNLQVHVPLDEIVSRLRNELEPALRSAAKQAASQEHERTRDWLESRGLPKAARVAQRETYNVLRAYGFIKQAAQTSHAATTVGHPVSDGREAQPLVESEVAELAGACVAMLEAQGRALEESLSEMSVVGGGFLLPEDARRVRAKAEALLGEEARRSEEVF